MHRMYPFCTVLAVLCLEAGAACGLTFSVNQGPCGSASLYNDGTLIVYSTALGGPPDAVHSMLSQYPIDALDIGVPGKGLVTGTWSGGRQWTNVTLSGALLFSLDQGDPFPKYIKPDSSEEIRVAWRSPTGEYVTKTAQGYNMFLGGDQHTAVEPNMGLGPGGGDDIDAVDSRVNPDFTQDLVFFSIDDRYSLVPNAPTDMRTCDVYVRFPNGGVAKAIDGVGDLGLAHEGDGSLPRFYQNDDIDALEIVSLDDCDTNNFMKQITYRNPETGENITTVVDLGDGVLFSLDSEEHLPYANGGHSPRHFRPSLPTDYIWFSSYGGLSTLDNLISHAQLGLNANEDDVDGLAMGQAYEIPEPTMLSLLGSLAAVLVGLTRRRRLKA